MGSVVTEPEKVVHQCDIGKVNSLGSQEDAAHHVIGNVQAEGSRFVVDEGCRVGGECRHADVQHVVDLRWQVKGCGAEWRLLMLPNVVKFTLNDKDTAETEDL